MPGNSSNTLLGNCAESLAKLPTDPATDASSEPCAGGGDARGRACREPDTAGAVSSGRISHGGVRRLEDLTGDNAAVAGSSRAVLSSTLSSNL